MGNHGAAGGISERRPSSCSSLFFFLYIHFINLTNLSKIVYADDMVPPCTRVSVAS